jgi:hypothetical protein
VKGGGAYSNGDCWEDVLQSLSDFREALMFEGGAVAGLALDVASILIIAILCDSIDCVMAFCVVIRLGKER